MDISKITKSVFDKVYNKYSPNWCIKMAYKYFSKESARKNMKINDIIIGILLIFFIIGIAGVVIDLPETIIAIVTYLYGGILSSLIIFLLAAILMNNARLNKIMRKLGVSKREYEDLVDKFYQL